MATIDFFSPIVSKRLKFILSFISFNDKLILIKHSWFSGKESFKIFLSKWVKSITFVFNCCISFFLSFFDFKFLLLHLLRLSLGSFRGFSRFSTFCFFLWNLCFFEPLLNQITFFKRNYSIFWKFDFEWNSKSLLFRSLRLGYKVSNLFIESINTWLILDQNLNSFFSWEFYCFTWRNLCTCLVNEFSLFLRIKRWVQTQIFLTFNKIPVKFDSIVWSLVKSIIWHSEKRTFDCCH